MGRVLQRDTTRNSSTKSEALYDLTITRSEFSISYFNQRNSAMDSDKLIISLPINVTLCKINLSY